MQIEARQSFTLHKSAGSTKKTSPHKDQKFFLNQAKLWNFPIKLDWKFPSSPQSWLNIDATLWKKVSLRRLQFDLVNSPLSAYSNEQMIRVIVGGEDVNFAPFSLPSQAE